MSGVPGHVMQVPKAKNPNKVASGKKKKKNTDAHAVAVLKGTIGAQEGTLKDRC